MKTFKFYEDVKHSIWLRNHFEIEAETEEEAIQKAIMLFDENHVPDENWEYLYDTLEELQPSDNDGQTTRELFFNDTGETLADNI
jgi:hypothetical protein